jgi:hypothetical protein
MQRKPTEFFLSKFKDVSAGSISRPISGCQKYATGLTTSDQCAPFGVPRGSNEKAAGGGQPNCFHDAAWHYIKCGYSRLQMHQRERTTCSHPRGPRSSRQLAGCACGRIQLQRGTSHIHRPPEQSTHHPLSRDSPRLRDRCRSRSSRSSAPHLLVALVLRHFHAAFHSIFSSLFHPFLLCALAR